MMVVIFVNDLKFVFFGLMVCGVVVKELYVLSCLVFLGENILVMLFWIILWVLVLSDWCLSIVFWMFIVGFLFIVCYLLLVKGNIGVLSWVSMMVVYVVFICFCFSVVKLFLWLFVKIVL